MQARPRVTAEQAGDEGAHGRRGTLWGLVITLGHGLTHGGVVVVATQWVLRRESSLIKQENNELNITFYTKKKSVIS